MVELDELTRRALLARDGPPAHARAEVLAGLQARLGGGAGPDADPSSAGELGGGPPPLDGGLSAGQLVWAAKLTGATLGLAAAGLLTLKLGAGLVAGGVPSEVEGEGAEVATLEPSGAQTVAPAVAPSTRDEPGSGEGTTRDASAGEVTPAREAARAREADSSQPGAGRSDSSLAAELELVRAAKRLTAQPEAALVQLERHRERFEAGVLAPERELLRIEMLCALGRHADAAKARAAFLRQFPDSPLRARLGQDCHASGTDPSAAGDGSR
jgi:hypothetical protein